MKLANYVEQISNDFESTFLVKDENTLVNMLGSPADYCILVDIIRKYIPNARVTFTKGNNTSQYDIYEIGVQ